MGLLSGPKFDGSATNREEELWKLVNSLQEEKAQLREECLMWRERYLTLTGLGNQTLPTSEAGGPVMGKPLGSHVSLMALRHKHEEMARARARERVKTDNDPA